MHIANLDLCAKGSDYSIPATLAEGAHVSTKYHELSLFEIYSVFKSISITVRLLFTSGALSWLDDLFGGA